MKFNSWMLPFLDAATEGTQGGAPDASAPWYAKAGVAPEHHEWLAAKEFADPSIAIASYRSLEGMVGRQRLAVPNNADDKDAYQAIYRTLGRPEKPEEYKLPEPVAKVFKQDEWKQFAPIFHEAGISQAQTERITTAYAERAAKIEEAKEAERAANETREIEALEKEWASNTQANKDIASRAFRALGINEEMTGKLESALGYKATMQLFHNIGKGMSESAFHQDTEKRTSTGSTVEQLDTKINGLMKDPEFKARYNNPNPNVRRTAIEEMEKLQVEKAELIAARQKQGAGA